MEVSARTIREVQFREKMRGYNQEEVDNFLEELAVGVDAIQESLRASRERADRAESAAAEVGGTDETLRKTLVLAQRTADLAVQEARDQAARILGSAEQQAQTLLAEAEERSRKTLEESVAQGRAELIRIEASCNKLRQEAETLQKWLEDHKNHLRTSLVDALAEVDRIGVLWPAPDQPEVPASNVADKSPRQGQAAQGPSSGTKSKSSAGDPTPKSVVSSPPPPPPALEPEVATIDLSTASEDSEEQPAPGGERAASASTSEDTQLIPRVGNGEETPFVGDEAAMDQFFDDPAPTEAKEEGKVGGRLRRRW